FPHFYSVHPSISRMFTQASANTTYDRRMPQSPDNNIHMFWTYLTVRCNVCRCLQISDLLRRILQHGYKLSYSAHVFHGRSSLSFPPKYQSGTCLECMTK